VKAKHKIHYLQLIDLPVAELDRRFDQPGMSNLLLIERVLTGKAEPGDVSTIVRTHENFIPCRSSLQCHLESLKELCGSDQSNWSEVFKKLRDVREKKLDILFKDVIVLARIYMACSVTSVECERSSSVMRRLKTWLRRTTGQSSLNHKLLLVIHSAREVRVDDVIHDFLSLNEQRQDDLGM
jgi:hAT family C-terminal dimerisation region